MFDKHKNNTKDRYVMAVKTTPLFRGAFTCAAYDQVIVLSKQIEKRKKD